MMGKVVLAHENIDAVHLSCVGKDGVHARDITEDVATVPFDMCLTPRWASCGLSFNAGPKVSQHLHDSLLLSRECMRPVTRALAAQRTGSPYSTPRPCVPT